MRETALFAMPLVGWAAKGMLMAQIPAADPGGLPALLTALANLGGLGLLAMVLWRLHDQARQDAREDRAAERKLWNDHLAEFRSEADRRHAELMEAIQNRRD
jgi:hypothetical protein